MTKNLYSSTYYTVEGNINCGKVLKNQKKSDWELSIVRWMQGYITARNWITKTLKENKQIMFDRHSLYFSVIK